MLNCFYLYGVIWTVVIFLYDLGWSDYCTPLNIWLRIFIYFSILVSFSLGYILRKNLKFRRNNEEFNIGNTGTIVICLVQLLEYIYCRNIPLFNVLLNIGNYGDFGGIPTLHVIIYTYATFYCQYLFYGYLNEHKKSYIRNYIIIVFTVYGLQFMRGGFVVCLAISGIMLLSTVEKKIKPKHIVYTVVVLLVALYIFGAVGNIRQGYSWNDSSAFMRFGRINDKFPVWLPKQFSWVYSYVVGSLATLNFNINSENLNPNLIMFIQSIFPDFIQRRLWPNFQIASASLIWWGFTTTTGYFYSYYYGGMIGIYSLFLILIALALFVTRSNRVKEKYRVLTLANIGVIMSLFFFTNTIRNSAIGFSIVYPILFSIIRLKIKFKFGDKNIVIIR